MTDQPVEFDCECGQHIVSFGRVRELKCATCLHLNKGDFKWYLDPKLREIFHYDGPIPLPEGDKNR